MPDRPTIESHTSRYRHKVIFCYPVDAIFESDVGSMLLEIVNFMHGHYLDCIVNPERIGAKELKFVDDGKGVVAHSAQLMSLCPYEPILVCLILQSYMP